MAPAAPAASGMSAVLGCPDGAAEQACASSGGEVAVANYNAPGQVVISGSEAGLSAVTPRLAAAGAKRLVRLPVSGAFHSPLMAHAAQVFAAAWEKIPLRVLRCPEVFNADAQVHQDPAEVRSLMVGQLTGPVRWTQSIQRLQQLGAGTYIESGPPRPLPGLVTKIATGAT